MNERARVPWGLYTLSLLLPLGGLLAAGLLYSSPGLLHKDEPDQDRKEAGICLLLALAGFAAWYAGYVLFGRRR